MSLDAAIFGHSALRCEANSLPIRRMVGVVIICGAIGLYLIIATTILRLATRMVAGIMPTFSSATGTIVASLLLSAIVWGVAFALGAGRGGFRIPLFIVSLLLQTMVYAATIKDREGADVSFGQAFLIILCQIPVAIGLAFAVGLCFAAGGLTLASLIPHPPHFPELASPPPQRLVSRPSWGSLAMPITIPTKYGNITHRAGTPVQIVRETSTGYLVRINGTDVTTSKEQILISR